MSAATVILIKMKRYIRIFREAGAVHPAAAIVPAEYGVPQSLIFRKLVRQGVFVQVNSDRYYLDEAIEAQYRKRRLMMVRILLLLIIIGLLISLFANRQF